MFIQIINEATAFQRPASLPCAPGVLDWNSGDHLDGFPGAKGPQTRETGCSHCAGPSTPSPPSSLLADYTPALGGLCFWMGKLRLSEDVTIIR